MLSWRGVLLLLLPIAGQLALTSGRSRDPGDVTEYCVIGAGPAGLQMGYLLKRAGRDHVLLERDASPGSFFKKYPRHRTLISINKQHTGKVNREFNERHDWNSLLSDDPSLVFRRYSSEFFPHADAMVEYLRDFQRKTGLNVRYGVNVTRVERAHRDMLLLQTSAGVLGCRYVIVATGLWQPNKPAISGHEHIQHYDQVAVDPERFRGQNVLILGRGNAAFETASNISGHTNLVHMVARSRARLAWSTHYVGDLRAINNNLLDTYQLKSLDGLLETDIEEIRLVRHEGRIHVRPAVWWSREPRAHTVHHALVTSLNRTANGSDACSAARDVCAAPPPGAAQTKQTGGAELQDNFSMRDGYDAVVGCLGFKFDFSIFDSATSPGTTSAHAKFPAVKADWGSPVSPGLYFAGVASHALDFRRSAGGFIHGFRYTARALHRILEWRNHRSAWPATLWPLAELVNVVVRRLNTAAGPYQMFSVLCDIIVFQKSRGGFLLVPEFPVALLHRFTETTGHTADQLLVLSLEYGDDFSGPEQDTFRWDRAVSDPLHADKSNFLHPVMYFYQHPPTEVDMMLKPTGRALPTATLIHHVLEDFLTDWTARRSHVLPLRRFLEACMARDLRHFRRASCLRHALTTGRRPLMCS
ncbi:FAD-dependent oxidoreductase domain-containing protein 2-like [Pollicipes pollicipes]|nr:FAD-dependent oxidoreductase domain-containing protein 2-like [Pollicipes pollicipes]